MADFPAHWRMTSKIVPWIWSMIFALHQPA